MAQSSSWSRETNPILGLLPASGLDLFAIRADLMGKGLTLYKISAKGKTYPRAGRILQWSRPIALGDLVSVTERLDISGMSGNRSETKRGNRRILFPRGIFCLQSQPEIGVDPVKMERNLDEHVQDCQLLESDPASAFKRPTPQCLSVFLRELD
ncbi:hypothetical protein MRS44_017616 [Fusarium solani]|uniref:uncharacterized protein n=1 Tax=Fusarium solani TaxID=169388 RepID=UPI0032C44307|nr:hypothetical protein MRS44_017616 [Fusarium solani]